MIGFFVGLLTFFVTTAAGDAHKSAKQRMDSLFFLFTDAFRAIKQLDQVVPQLDQLDDYLRTHPQPVRAMVPAYHHLDPTGLSIELAKALSLVESGIAINYFASWKQMAGLLARYEAQYARMYLGKDPFTADDVEELLGTVRNAAFTASTLRLAALRLCRCWFEARYVFSGREPDPEQDSQQRWASVDALAGEIAAAEQDEDLHLQRLREPTMPPQLPAGGPG